MMLTSQEARIQNKKANCPVRTVKNHMYLSEPTQGSGPFLLVTSSSTNAVAEDLLDADRSSAGLVNTSLASFGQNLAYLVASREI
jgi:hypothetical protein